AAPWSRPAWAIAIAGILLVFPLIVIGMFVYFTRPWESGVIGVQGRYYIVPLFLLSAIGLRWLSRRFSPSEKLRALSSGFGAPLGAAVCVAAIACALEVMYAYFWV